jgi:hypothetical protein
MMATSKNISSFDTFNFGDTQTSPKNLAFLQRTNWVETTAAPRPRLRPEMQVSTCSVSKMAWRTRGELMGNGQGSLDTLIFTLESIGKPQENGDLAT